MEKQTFTHQTLAGRSVCLDLFRVHTLVVGSGAAGLNAAVQLKANGIDDLLVVTEGLQMGTSINTGSDKQTYYKIGICGNEPDCPEAVAEALFSGGSMHGDLSLVEAAMSVRGFMNLVNLGVPFPRDRFGQFVGYKTDHDPRQRATSVGPYTSREMCRCLIQAVKRLDVPIHEKRQVVSLLTVKEGNLRRAAGAVVLNYENDKVGGISGLEVIVAENVVFAVGGPGGLYKTSVYPTAHTGGIGIALFAGAEAQNLPESQYGLASVKFRWNVSGSYMQVIPRLISTAEDGCSQEKEFLKDFFDSPGQMNSAIFLKGYQWPFDCRKITGGSSIIDILVYSETVLKGRRVFLDYRMDSETLSFDDLSPEARRYLIHSNCLLPSPIERLHVMNPDAVSLYRDNGIDIRSEPLEIAVCAQHNNGGLAGNIWWESTTVMHLFPVGEVNGSHGVARPGGTALNSGQVGGYRAAEYIGNRYSGWSLDAGRVETAIRQAVGDLERWIVRAMDSPLSWSREREALKSRMTAAGAHIRSPDRVKRAVSEAWRQWHRIDGRGCKFSKTKDLREALITRQLCFAHCVYLDAIRFALESGVGSRGSAMVLDENGDLPNENLGDKWRFAKEDETFRNRVLTTVATPEGKVKNRWVNRRPIPHTDAWFETTWAAYKKGDIFR